MSARRRIRDLFCRAVELDPGDRDRFLAEACAGDQPLRDRVDELLRAHSEVGEFLQAPELPLFGSLEDSGSDPRVGESSGEDTPRTDPVDRPELVDQPRLVEPYRIVRPLGQGGMGVVYLAEQLRPVQRMVALKLVRSGMDSREILARFDTERRALARMSHPSIAAIYDAGVAADGRPYFAMEHVDGLHLTDHCDAERLTIAERLRLFLTVCHAVQHAHQRGVIHRDLKPSNVLVHTASGEAVPKVIDFGVAKATEEELAGLSRSTRTGLVIGTPAYMSPEQLAGSSDIDTRSDVHALGAILHELLVGAPPMDSAGSAARSRGRPGPDEAPSRPSARLRRVRESSEIAAARSTSVARLERRLRGDLDWITMKALEPDRDDRYATAAELAADVSRHLAQEPVTAGPPSVTYRLRRICARHRSTVVAAALAALLVVGGLAAVAAVQTIERQRAQDLATRLQENLYAADIRSAMGAAREGNFALASRLLARHEPTSGQRDLRGFEWRHLSELCRRNDHRRFVDGSPHDLSRSPDGRLIACVASELETARVRDIATGEIVADLPGRYTSIEFSPDGALLAAGENHPPRLGANMAVKVWSTADWREIRTLRPRASPVAFSPDGRWLAAMNGFEVYLHSTESWDSVARCTGNPHWTFRHVLAFSPDSSALVTTYFPGVRLWKVPSLEALPYPETGAEKVTAAAFLQDSRRLLLGSAAGEIVLWDLVEQAIVHRFDSGHSSGVTAIKTASRGHTYATGGDQALFVRDSGSHAVVARLRAHDAGLWALDVDAAGETLATGGFDRTTRLWQMPEPESPAPLRGPLRALRAAPGGSDIITALDGFPAVYDHRSHEPSTWPLESRGFARWSLSPRATLLAGRAPENAIEIWRVADREPLRTLRLEGELLTAPLRFSRDDELLVGARRGGPIEVWSVSTGELRAQLPHEASDVTELELSADGATLAASCVLDREFLIQLWDVPTSRLRARLEGHRMFTNALRFSPDDALLASGSADSMIKLWDLASGRELATLSGHVSPVFGLAFSPNGRTLASISSDDHVKLWSVPTHRELLTLELEGAAQSSSPDDEPIAFSEDGRLLVASETLDGEARPRVWKAPPSDDGP